MQQTFTHDFFKQGKKKQWSFMPKQFSIPSAHCAWKKMLLTQKMPQRKKHCLSYFPVDLQLTSGCSVQQKTNTGKNIRKKNHKKVKCFPKTQCVTSAEGYVQMMD